MGKSQGTWGGLEPRQWPSSWCACLWWSNNQPDEPSVSLGTPVSWKTGERQMFSTTEQSQAVIHRTNPARYFPLLWQLPGRNAELLPPSPTVAWLWQCWHWAEGVSPDLSRLKERRIPEKKPSAHVWQQRGAAQGCVGKGGMLILGWGNYWFRHPRTLKTSQLYPSSTLIYNTDIINYISYSQCIVVIC